MVTLVNEKLRITNIDSMLRSLIISKVLDNVKDIVKFLPAVIALFFFLSVLRSAKCVTHMTFIVSGLLQGVKLSKEDFIPVLVKFNYSIPTVVTAEALSDRHSQGVAVLVAPFVDYDTGLPVCKLLADTFFPGR